MAKLSHIQDGQKLSHQIFQTLIAFIQENKLSNGERLPSQTLLAEQLNVSRTSLREALAQLQMGGIIKHKHGEGTFVTCNPDEIMTKTDISFNTSGMIEAQGMTPNTSEVVVSLVKEKDVDHVYKDRLNVSEGEQLTRIERVRTGDDVPFAYVITYSSVQKVHLDLEPEIYRGSLYDYFEEHHNQVITEVEAQIEACIADEVISKKLSIPKGTPILTLHQCHYTSDGEALIISEEYYVQNPLSLTIKRYRMGQMFL